MMIIRQNKSNCLRKKSQKIMALIYLSLNFALFWAALSWNFFNFNQDLKILYSTHRLTFYNSLIYEIFILFYILHATIQDVKYSSTQYIVPESKLWGIPALCYDLNLGMIFFFNQDFLGLGVVVGVCMWGNAQKSWFQ